MFFTSSFKIAATTPQRSLSHALHGVRCCGSRDTVRSMWRFLSAWRKQKMSQWLPQRCSPCQSRPLRRGGYFGEGQGKLFWAKDLKFRHGVGSSQSTCIFWRWREFHRNRKHSRSTITWRCMLSWCFHGFLRWVSLIMNRHTSAYITWTSLMVRLKI